MASTKKPRKSYTPRPTLLPGNMKRVGGVDLPGRIGLIALGKDWFSLDHLMDLAAMYAIAEKVAEAVRDEEAAKAIEIGIAALNSIEERRTQSGKLGATGDEMRTLREYTGAIMEWLNEQPNTVIHEQTTRMAHKLENRT